MPEHSIQGPFPPITIGTGACPACASRSSLVTKPGLGPGDLIPIGELYNVERYKRAKWMERYDPGDARVYGSMSQWAKFLGFCEQCWTMVEGGRLRQWIEQESKRVSNEAGQFQSQRKA